MDSNIIVLTVANELRVDSRLIALDLGIKHKNIYENIFKYKAKLEQFGQLPFETETVTNSVGATNEVKFALLNEAQSYFLMTLSRNTKKVVQAKLNLVMQFSQAKGALLDNYNGDIDSELVKFKKAAISKAYEAWYLLDQYSKEVDVCHLDHTNLKAEYDLIHDLKLPRAIKQIRIQVLKNGNFTAKHAKDDAVLVSCTESEEIKELEQQMVTAFTAKNRAWAKMTIAERKFKKANTLLSSLKVFAV